MQNVLFESLDKVTPNTTRVHTKLKPANVIAISK